MFHHGNIKDYLLKLLSLLLHLMIVLWHQYYGTKSRVKFTGSCFHLPKVSYTHGTIENIYIAYELGASSPNDNDPTLKNSLFSAVRLTTNADINSTSIPVMKLDLIENQVFHFQVVDLVKI